MKRLLLTFPLLCLQIPFLWSNVYYHLLNPYDDGEVINKWNVSRQEAIASGVYLVEYTDDMDRVSKLIFYGTKGSAITEQYICYEYTDSAIVVYNLSEPYTTIDNEQEEYYGLKYKLSCYYSDKCCYIHPRGIFQQYSATPELRNILTDNLSSDDSIYYETILLHIKNGDFQSNTYEDSESVNYTGIPLYFLSYKKLGQYAYVFTDTIVKPAMKQTLRYLHPLMAEVGDSCYVDWKDCFQVDYDSAIYIKDGLVVGIYLVYNKLIFMKDGKIVKWIDCDDYFDFSDFCPNRKGIVYYGSHFMVRRQLRMYGINYYSFSICPSAKPTPLYRHISYSDSFNLPDASLP